MSYMNRILSIKMRYKDFLPKRDKWIVLIFRLHISLNIIYFILSKNVFILEPQTHYALDYAGEILIGSDFILLNH